MYRNQGNIGRHFNDQEDLSGGRKTLGTLVMVATQQAVIFALMQPWVLKDVGQPKSPPLGYSYDLC
jgi:hypothetical protein